MQEKERKQKRNKPQNKQISYVSSNENLKYLSRSNYYGTLKDYEYVNDCLVLKVVSYVATIYTGTTTIIRIYVPTDMDYILDNIECGSNYYFITAPYKVSFNRKYPYRVDLLLRMFADTVC